MKEKTKQFLKKYLIGFILGVVSAGVVIVYAETYFPSNDVTYDNTESGLTSTNVQGAIDELYTECTKEPTAGETIIEDARLEKDPYECRYFFTGANPNNYITFNGETAGWQILSVECDGTIKIVKKDSLIKTFWDMAQSNNWTNPSSLNTYLNSTYYNELSTEVQNQITLHNFSIGMSIWSDDIASAVNIENSILWEGNIGLPTVSEYIRTNSNKQQCGNIELNYDNYNTCKSTSWMNNNNSWWTLSRDSGNTNAVYYIETNGKIINYDALNGDYGVRPTLYLSKDIKITGGTGTESDPYTIN